MTVGDFFVFFAVVAVGMFLFLRVSFLGQPFFFLPLLFVAAGLIAESFRELLLVYFDLMCFVQRGHH